MSITKANIINIAKDFKLKAGIKNSIPYDISGAVSLVMPIDIISLSELSLSKIQQWLNDREILFTTEVDNRLLHGFIIIFKGNGFLFVNGTDSEEDRRFTIAHEVSHFILDYQLKRNRAIKKIGIEILEVLDGYRQPTIDEQIDGVLLSVDVTPFTHMVEKDGDGSFESLKNFNAENNADTLALELLAPSQAVIKEIKSKGKLNYSLFKEDCYNLLVEKYKLPENISEQYSGVLAFKATGGPSVLDKLGF